MVEWRITSCRYSAPLLQNREEEAEEAADDALVTSGGLHATLDTHHQTQPVLVQWMARQGGRTVRLESRQRAGELLGKSSLAVKGDIRWQGGRA